MRYIICVVVLSLLCAKIISAGKSEHAIMMQEIAEANRILEASVTPIHYDIKPREPDPEPIDESTVIVTAGPADK